MGELTWLDWGLLLYILSTSAIGTRCLYRSFRDGTHH